MPQSNGDAAAGEAASDLALLIKAVREAGPIALASFRRGGETTAESWSKSHDDSLVTAADLAVNAALREILTGARPDYGWLSEEDADAPDRLERERVFLVDPIDGTRSFAEGRPEFCLSVAVAEAGEPVAAAIFAPALDALYAAGAELGATLNGAAIRASARGDVDGAQALGTKRTYRAENWPGGAPRLELRYIQPIAYRLCMIGEGRWDLAVSLRPTNEWDVAAGDLIVREAGGGMSDPMGGALRYNKAEPRVAGVVASGGRLHPELIRRLR